jgi:hypothetical protein
MVSALARSDASVALVSTGKLRRSSPSSCVRSKASSHGVAGTAAPAQHALTYAIYVRSAGQVNNSAPHRLRGPPDAARREPRRLSRGLPRQLPRLRARPALAQPCLETLSQGLEEIHETHGMSAAPLIAVDTGWRFRPHACIRVLGKSSIDFLEGRFDILSFRSKIDRGVSGCHAWRNVVVAYSDLTLPEVQGEDGRRIHAYWSGSRNLCRVLGGGTSGAKRVAWIEDQRKGAIPHPDLSLFGMRLSGVLRKALRREKAEIEKW